MAEYIEKEVAIKELCETYEHEYPTASGAFDEYATRIVPNVLRNLPPAAVLPVMRGRWVKVRGFFTPGGDPVWQCSECGKGRHVYGVEHGTYGADVSDGQWLACPNCMAIMEGESDG